MGSLGRQCGSHHNRRKSVAALTITACPLAYRFHTLEGVFFEIKITIKIESLGPSIRRFQFYWVCRGPLILRHTLFFRTENMAELKNIRIAVSGIYDYAFEEIPTLRIPMPGQGAPDWVEEKRLYKVYRPASVLAVACPKFANLPMTHHHPKTPVDGQNFRDLAIGWTGEHPEVDYIAETNEVGIKSTCMLYDDEALQAYENGEIQLSPGYIAVFEWQKGTTAEGQEYDIIMRKITDVNHLALLPAGRGGEYAVVMDQAPQRKTVFEIAKSKNLFDVAKRRILAQK